MKSIIDQTTRKEVIKNFIINYINVNPNNYVKSSNLHYYFCILHNLNQRSMTSHSFIPLFLNIFEEIHGQKLKTKSLRVKKGESVARYIEGIYLKAVSKDTAELLLNNKFAIKLTEIESNVQNNKQEKALETKGELSTNKQTSNKSNTSKTSTKLTDDKIKAKATAKVQINLDELVSYFEPGEGKYPTEFVLDLAKKVYKNSEVHLNYLKLENIKPFFKQEWLKKHPQNPLIDIRITVEGHPKPIRGIGNLKKVKD